jgi:Pyridine nucleotide-disulphide oxidoreductase
MCQTSQNDFLNIRIVNFSNVELLSNNVLCFDSGDIGQIIKEVRKYADLPYVYLLSKEQKTLALDLLSSLREIKSPCYPYALFCVDDLDLKTDLLGLDIVKIAGKDTKAVSRAIKEYAASRFDIDYERLKIHNSHLLPENVDVVIIGAGVTGIFAANKLMERNISVCVVDKRDMVGGIWSRYANGTSQVNTSEGAYRIINPDVRSNRDHSTTREILEDIIQLSDTVSDRLYLNTEVKWFGRSHNLYKILVERNGEASTIESKGIILAINDRVGTPRQIEWEGQSNFQGEIVSGISNNTKAMNWKNKRVVVIGMGAFATENARTALEGGASLVTVVCRRHGTVCPKIIDYLNFSAPYDENFKHDKKSNMRNMIYWKKLYDLSGATQPECWMGKIKHEGHTISVSDIWFIGHYLKKLKTVTGSITGMHENGVIVENQHHIEADVVINCVGFHRNAPIVKSLCDYKEMYNNNYLDKDLMYLADAYLDNDDVFNSFFGSSVLEMVKFYIEVYIKFFNNSAFDDMIKTDGTEKISIEDRRWSHYIAGATALINNYPDIHEIAMRQIAERTNNFLQVHDIETYISENKREWVDIHSLLAGKRINEEECLPYVFEKVLNKKV